MLSKYFLACVLSALCALAAASLIEDVDPVLSQQQFALNLVKHAYGRRMGMAAAASDDECFYYYFTEQDNISKAYNAEYNVCKATAQDAKDKLTIQSSEKRSEVISRGDATCSDLQNCQQYEDGLDFFNCYSDASGANYQVLYNLYTESSGEATNLHVSYQTIDNNERSCTTVAKNKYVASMSACNSNLDKCLNGAPLPTETTANPTVEPTTKPVTEPTPTEPQTTTDEPATTTTTVPSTLPAGTTTTESAETQQPETTTPAPTTTEEPTTTAASSVETPEPETTTNAPTTTEEPTTTAASSVETPEPETTTNAPTTTEEPTTTAETAPNTPEQPETTTPEESGSSAFTTDEPATTTEPSPEEDLSGFKSNFNLWKILKELGQ